VRIALRVALLGSLALALASCGEGGSGSGTNGCTPEALQAKHKDLQDAMTAALAKDPAKASNSQAWAKALELMSKAQSAGDKPSEDLCKAYDQQIETVKKQSS
jgi:hypothetical protein